MSEQVKSLVESLQAGRISRRQFVDRALMLGLSLSALGPLLAACSGGGSGRRPIKVGLLIPFTGLETHNGLSMHYGALIAADEINAAGGAAGRQLELVAEDTTSVPDVARQKAQKLLQQDKVDVLIGTLISSERNAVYELTTKQDALLLNPTFYEGVDLCHETFFSTGAVPNQNIEPLVDYALKNLGKSFYFVGSDYVWPRGSIAAAKEAIAAGGGTVLGEEYTPFGTTDFSAIIRRIESARPDILFPFAAGQDGITFLKQVHDFGLKQKLHIVANYIDELIVPALSADAVVGLVNSSSYTMAIDTPENKRFLESLKKRDEKALMGNFGMNMYYNVKFYAEAVSKAGTTAVDKVIAALENARTNGPAGEVTLQAGTHHAVIDSYLCEIQADKSFRIIDVARGVAPKVPCQL